MVEYIQVPDLNDSFSRVVLCRREYLIRFVYNGGHDYWSFGIYDTDRNILLQHRKIVPLCPLTHFDVSVRVPAGIFGCFTNLKRIGRKDFAAGKAEFAFIPWDDLAQWRKDHEFI